MSVETVSRVSGMDLVHQAIARHFGDDRCRRDRCALAIALHNTALCHEQRGDTKSVHQDDVGERREGVDGPLHRLERGLMNIDLVDLGRLRRRDRPPDGALQDFVVKALALQRGARLRVG
jgi:hypothetical protein